MSLRGRSMCLAALLAALPVGTAYRARLRVADAGALKVEGCVVGGLVCRTQEWSRVQ